MKLDDVKKNKNLKHFGMITKKNGEFIARWEYLSKAGDIKSNDIANIIRDEYPEATIIASGDEYHEFKVGQPVSKRCHFWVKFKLPNEVVRKSRARSYAA